MTVAFGDGYSNSYRIGNPQGERVCDLELAIPLVFVGRRAGSRKEMSL